MKNCIVYHYYEKDETYKDNLRHFLSFAIADQDDYFILISGHCSVTIPENNKNITKVVYPNHNLDYGAYCKFINNGIKFDEYRFVFFVNSSVRGPFTPPYSKYYWPNIFIQEFSKDVGIVGSTINILNPRSHEADNYNKLFGNRKVTHVQTTAYCLSRESLQRLIDYGFYQEAPQLDKYSIISTYEIRLSQVLISFGYKIRSICPEFNAIELSKDHHDPNPTSANGDMLVDKGYWGRTVHPYEILFIKTNRSLINLEYLDRLSASMLAARQSNEDNYIDCSYREKLVSGSSSSKRVHTHPLSLDAKDIINIIHIISKKRPDLYKIILENLPNSNQKF